MEVMGIAASVIAAVLSASRQDPDPKYETAILAGGCFWCMQGPFEQMDGVIEVSGGYTGGRTENPTYDQVSSGITGHVEAVQITYDPSKVSFRQLLEVFWRQIDPTDPGGQFADRGTQYQTAIFYRNDEQKRIAEESKRELGNSGKFDKPIATRIEKAAKFYPAEDYHQQYYKKNPTHYRIYKKGSGREDYIHRTWERDMEDRKQTDGSAKQWKDFAKPSAEELKKRLTPQQYAVTQQCSTEPPFQNEYWDNHREGIYVDAVSGEPLFSSKDKFDSRTGWPSFTRPLKPENVKEKEDRSIPFQTRIEIRSAHGDSHLGHVFPDGPAPTGQRYCVNSAAVRFIPKEKLVEEGYGEFLEIFR